MAIVVEKQDGGGGVRGGGGEEGEEEGKEEEDEEEEDDEEEAGEGSTPRGTCRRDLQLLFHLQLGEQQSPQRHPLAPAGRHSRSSSVTSWDSGSTAMTPPELSELGSARYSATLDPEDLQQELVVKAIRVKKKTRRGRKGRTCLSAALLLLHLHLGPLADAFYPKRLTRSTFI